MQRLADMLGRMRLLNWEQRVVWGLVNVFGEDGVSILAGNLMLQEQVTLLMPRV